MVGQSLTLPIPGSFWSSEVKCAHCQRSFVGRRADALYCSELCSGRASNRRAQTKRTAAVLARRAARRAIAAAHRVEVEARKAARAQAVRDRHAAQRAKVKTCIGCLRPFVIGFQHGGVEVCSPECRETNRKASARRSHVKLCHERPEVRRARKQKYRAEHPEATRRQNVKMIARQRTATTVMREMAPKAYYALPTQRARRSQAVALCREMGVTL